MLFSKYLQILKEFLSFLTSHRSMIRLMAIRTIKYRYAGTLVGILWSFINPLMIILVYWFIFSVGFKIQPANNVPFVLVFFCGLLPWLTFSESLNSTTECIVKNPHLVKKIIFPTEILPLINLVASWISHGIMLLILLVIMFFHDFSFSIYNLQFFYYLLGLSVFCLGLGWVFAALNVYFRDIGQVLAVILNLWFWLTPIVWLPEMIPEKFRIFMILNPLYYIVEGYKKSFIYHVPFWQDLYMGLYFWGVSLLILCVGGMIFRRLKMEFAEVL